MKTGTIILLSASALGAAVVAALLLRKSDAGPVLAVGGTVRVPLSSAQIVLATNPTFQIPNGLSGIATVQVTDVSGDEVTGQILSVDTFTAIAGQDVNKFLARFSKSAILK